MGIIKALSRRQDSCPVLLTRSKLMTGYNVGPIGEPNAIIQLNGHRVKVSLPSAYLHTHRAACLQTLSQKLLCSQQRLTQRPTSGQHAEEKTVECSGINPDISLTALFPKAQGSLRKTQGKSIRPGGRSCLH